MSFPRPTPPRTVASARRSRRVSSRRWRAWRAPATCRACLRSSYMRSDDMSREDREDTTIYKVVLNHEQQYSIWPAHRENALGWQDAGKTGSKAECLAYIE